MLGQVCSVLECHPLGEGLLGRLLEIGASPSPPPARSLSSSSNMLCSASHYPASYGFHSRVRWLSRPSARLWVNFMRAGSLSVSSLPYSQHLEHILHRVILNKHLSNE